MSELGGRCKTVAAHNFNQAIAIWRTALSRVERGSNFTEILRTDGSRCDYTQHLRIVGSVIVKAVNSPAPDTNCLSRANTDFPSFNRPAQNTLDAVDGLFVLVVAMGWHIQTSSGRYNELKGGDSAVGVIACD